MGVGYFYSCGYRSLKTDVGASTRRDRIGGGVPLRLSARNHRIRRRAVYIYTSILFHRILDNSLGKPLANGPHLSCGDVKMAADWRTRLSEYFGLDIRRIKIDAPAAAVWGEIAKPVFVAGMLGGTIENANDLETGASFLVTTTWTSRLLKNYWGRSTSSWGQRQA